MSGRRDESLPLDDLVDAAERLVELGGREPEGTLGVDRGLNEMILWNLLVLGEATKRLRPATRSRYPDVPWREMAKTRDRVAHDYDGVDWYIVTRIIVGELPELVPKLRAIRAELRAEFDAT